MESFQLIPDSVGLMKMNEIYLKMAFSLNIQQLVCFLGAEGKYSKVMSNSE
jgi:hypothetical protein